MNTQELYSHLGKVVEPDILESLADLEMISQVTKKLGGYSVELLTYPANGGYFDPIADQMEQIAREHGVLLEIKARAMTEPEIKKLESHLLDKTLIKDGENRVNRLMAPGSRTRVLGFSSGKGGVGKSSVTVGVASALARRGHSVGILDADVYGFSIPRMLGAVRPPSLIGKVMIPPVRFGIKTMSVGYFVADDTPVIWRGPMLHKALEQFLLDVFWGEIDYLCVDLPPGTGDVTLSLAEYLPKIETFVVTTPQDAAERVAQRSALAARKLKLPLRGVIENMSYFRGDDKKRYDIFGKGGGESLAQSLELPLIGTIPIEIALREGGDVGNPIVFASPESEVSVEFMRIAQVIEAMGPARIYKSELKVR